MRHTLTFLLTLTAVSIITFFALRSAGADPILSMVSPETLAANAENLDALRERLGLNDPLYVQYFRWLGGILRGDWGYSVTGTPVLQILFPRIIYTFQLSLVSLVLSAVIGILVGTFSAYLGGVFDHVSSALSSILLALPQFFCGIILVFLFAVKLPIFPAGNRVSPGDGSLLDVIYHMVLPAAALTLSLTAVVVRYTKAAVGECLSSDFVRFARARGVSERRILFSHALRCSSRPVVNLLVLRFPMLFSGAVVIESVFSYPGIGLAITNAVSSGDYPVVMASTLVIASAMLAASFLSDIIAALFDPRLRVEAKG